MGAAEKFETGGTLVVTLTQQELIVMIKDAVREALAANGNAKAADDLLTIKELAEKLDVTERSVRNWVKEGLPMLRAGSRMRFELPAVRDWFRERAVKDGGHVTRNVALLKKVT